MTYPNSFKWCILFVVVLHHSNSISVISWQRRRNPEPTFLLPKGILPYHIAMVRLGLAFDDAVSYTQWGNGLQHS